jgi:phosphoglycerol transferase MdoB-like AlkP superfamily enzyme
MNNFKKVLPYRSGWLFFCLLAIYSVVELLDRHYSTRTASQALPVIAMFCNALPAMLFLLALLGFTRRLFFAFLATIGICGAFYAISYLKQFQLGSPIMPADFHLARQMSSGGWEILSKYLPRSAKSYVAGAILFVALLWLWRKEHVFIAKGYWLASVLAGLVFACSLCALLAGTGPWVGIYRTNSLVSREVLYLPPLNAANNGLITDQIQLQIAARHSHIKADPRAGQAFIDKASPPPVSPPPGRILPDIIVIQSEAFFDPSILKGFDGPSTTIEYSRLAEHASSGPLHVPTIGGGTIRTEFEVLTGISMRYLRDIQYPYLQLDLHKTRNLVKVLKSNGYATTAIHGNVGAFWNRDDIFGQLGFDQFLTIKDFKHPLKDGSYTADSSMTDEIVRRLESGRSPQFIFAISIEAHGPYATGYANDAASRDSMPIPGGLNARQALKFRTYMYHARHADAELGRLAKWLDDRRRPYLLLFYGDHLPALHPIYQQVGFKDGKPEGNQPVPWILVDSRQSKPIHETLAAWMLPDLLLEHAGITDVGYFALTRGMRPILSTLTSAPGARPEPATPLQKEDDAAMGNVARLRLRGKL